MKITLTVGDITTFKGGAIVNAANNVGLGGGGVDGAIHQAAGPGLRQACESLPIYPIPGYGPGLVNRPITRVPTGGAVPTPGFNLPSPWVIHTAGPLWDLAPLTSESAMSPERRLRGLLHNCYAKPLTVAVGMGLSSIAYPAISTGVYGCPDKTCAEVVMACLQRYARNPMHVHIYIFGRDRLKVWTDTYEIAFGRPYEDPDAD